MLVVLGIPESKNTISYKNVENVFHTLIDDNQQCPIFTAT